MGPPRPDFGEGGPPCLPGPGSKQPGVALFVHDRLGHFEVSAPRAGEACVYFGSRGVQPDDKTKTGMMTGRRASELKRAEQRLRLQDRRSRVAIRRDFTKGAVRHQPVPGHRDLRAVCPEPALTEVGSSTQAWTNSSPLATQEALWRVLAEHTCSPSLMATHPGTP